MQCITLWRVYKATIVRFTKKKALESYRSGLDAISLRMDQAAAQLEESVRASYA